MTTSGSATVYVYGVLPASEGHSITGPGVAGFEVRTVDHAGLSALVSEVGGGPLQAAREVRAHWRVVEEAAKDATVLPVRFGTVLESDEAVRERLLEPNADTFARQLRELEGRVQLNVKGAYDAEELLREVVRQAPAVAALRERVRALPDEAGYYDRIRLGELVAAEIGRRRDADERLARDRLRSLAVAARAEPPKSAESAFDLAFLVARDRIDDFSAGVRGLDEEIGDRVRIRYIGPLPPYSFVDGAEWG